MRPEGRRAPLTSNSASQRLRFGGGQRLTVECQLETSMVGAAAIGSVGFGDVISFGQEFHGDAIYAIAQAGRWRPIAPAATTMHFRSDHSVAFIGGSLHRIGCRIVEARPAGAAFEFPLRGEQRLIAARADECAGTLLEVQRAAAARHVQNATSRAVRFAAETFIYRQDRRAPTDEGLTRW